MTISDERLAEMLAGLERVTPGPWKFEGSIYEHMGAGLRSIPDDRGFAQLWKSDHVALDAAHIARCDPDTMRSILTELQSLRAIPRGGIEDDPALAYQDAEERICECGAAGSGEGHSDFCPWLESAWKKWGDAFDPPLSAIEQEQEPVAWQDEVIAPKDGTMLRLLVEPDPQSHTSFEDSENHYETIGFNTLADTGEDEWIFAGWDWSHDCFTTGRGAVVGWRILSPSVCEGKVTEEMDPTQRFAKWQHEGAALAREAGCSFVLKVTSPISVWTITAALSQEGV